MTNINPNPDIDIQQISTRNQHARHIVVGFALDAPTLADLWRALDDALSDTIALCAQITRLSAELAATRLDRVVAFARRLARVALVGIRRHRDRREVAGPVVLHA